jgi:hypothetical protein
MSKCKSMVLESPRIMRMHEFDIPEVAEGDMLLKVDLVG